MVEAHSRSGQGAPNAGRKSTSLPGRGVGLSSLPSTTSTPHNIVILQLPPGPIDGQAISDAHELGAGPHLTLDEAQSGEGGPADSSENFNDVSEMVLRLMDGVPSQPGHVPFGGLRPVVDEWARPRVLVKAVEYKRTEFRSHTQMVENLSDVLTGIAAELNSLVAVHAGKARSLLDPGEDNPVALDDEHVTHMA